MMMREAGRNLGGVALGWCYGLRCGWSLLFCTILGTFFGAVGLGAHVWLGGTYLCAAP